MDAEEERRFRRRVYKDIRDNPGIVLALAGNAIDKVSNMLIYLASRFSNRYELRRQRDILTKAGYEVTSRWIDVEERPTGPELNRFWRKWVRKDIEDMNDCDVLILYTVDCDGENTSRGGMRFEQGYVYGKGKHVIVVGPRYMIFDELDDVEYCKDWDECYARLEELQNMY